MVKKFLLSILFMAVADVSLAAPSITGASGNFSHGSTFTITGSGFGIKNPAAPLVWDDDLVSLKSVDSISSPLRKCYIR